MLVVLTGVWPVVLLLGWVVLAGWASGHAILAKRDPRAAVGWTGLIWFAPYLGALTYLLLGINRVERRALRLRAGSPRYRAGGLATGGPHASGSKRPFRPTPFSWRRRWNA